MGPEYFCNRENECELLDKAIASNRNITLISQRRMGKTGLLKHTKYLLEKADSRRTVIYIDLLPTMNANEMLNQLASVLLRIKLKEKSFFERVFLLLSRLRPKMNYDPLTGQPSVELLVDAPDDIGFGLQNLMQLINEIDAQILFMLDEFQQIIQYPEKNIEHQLRSIFQTYPNIPFIFSGSSKHMLEAMFGATGRPFYQSSEFMYLGKIEPEVYEDFIIRHFFAAGMHIQHEAINYIFQWTRLHTYYVQYICNLLYETGEEMIDTKLVNRIFDNLFVQNEPLYVSYRNLLTSHQFKLLKAIAVENKISKPTAGAFIQDHKLVSASSVKTSLKALATKEMIFSEGNEWQITDVFFSRWLEYHYR
jgi:uncharacterized protein